RNASTVTGRAAQVRAFSGSRLQTNQNTNPESAPSGRYCDNASTICSFSGPAVAKRPPARAPTATEDHQVTSPKRLQRKKPGTPTMTAVKTETGRTITKTIGMNTSASVSPRTDGSDVAE